MTASNPAGSVPGGRPIQLVVYAREHCHLCDNMIAALQELQPRLHFCLDVTDVDSDDGLRVRYGESVPVLVTGDGEEICHYHLDRNALDAYLAKIR